MSGSMKVCMLFLRLKVSFLENMKEMNKCLLIWKRHIVVKENYIR